MVYAFVGMSAPLCSPSSPWYLTDGPPNFDPKEKFGKAVTEKLLLVQSGSPTASPRAAEKSQRTSEGKQCGDAGKAAYSSKRRRKREEQDGTGPEPTEGETAIETVGGTRKVQKNIGMMGVEKEETIIVTKNTVHSVLEEVKKEKSLTRDLAKRIALSVQKNVERGTGQKARDRSRVDE